jgi:broad specificity phosphatase PhoE
MRVEDIAMQIYIVRHGQSQNNSGDSSAHNVPLTSLGHRQIRQAAAALADQRFDALYCSPLERALQSASILHARLHVVPYVHPAFSETGFSWGEAEATREQLRSCYPYIRLDPSITNQGWAPSDRETEEEAYKRASGVISWLLERHPEPESKILIISHGHFGAILIGYLVGTSPCGYTRFSQNNAGISRVDIVDGQSKLRFLNRVSHLPGELLT